MSNKHQTKNNNNKHYKQFSSKDTIFVGGLPLDIQEQAIEAYFRQFGPIKQVFLKKKKRSDRLNIGYAYLVVGSQSAMGAILSRQFHYLGQRRVEVSQYFPKGEKRNQHLLDLQRRRLYIKAVPLIYSDDSLRQFFSRFGSV